METKCRLFGICGSSGSGKSFIAKYILENLGPENVSILYQDNYYKKREDQQKDNNGHYNFDLPSSFHQDEFFEDINIKGFSLLIVVLVSRYLTNKLIMKFHTKD